MALIQGTFQLHETEQLPGQSSSLKSVKLATRLPDKRNESPVILML